MTTKVVALQTMVGPKLLPKLEEIRFLTFDEKVLNEFQNQYSENMLKITTHMCFYRQPELKLQSIASMFTGFGGFHKTGEPWISKSVNTSILSSTQSTVWNN